MKRVIIESPLKGKDYDRNVAYAKRCLLDALKRNEAPLASHLLYPQVLDDKLMNDRILGMKAGWAWVPVTQGLIVYNDLGVSSGMEAAVEMATSLGIPIIHRTIGEK